MIGRRKIPALIGVVHLLPLPGAPRPSPGLDAVIVRACADARALAEGGADAAILENFGDAPFTGGTVDPFTVAAMTRIAIAVRDAAPQLPLGINVLRNDARAALGVAAAAGAVFIRINVHTGVMVTDQGVLTGDARGTLLERNRLGATVALVADVMVKHAVPLGEQTIEDAARDTLLRGHADVLVVTGRGTGLPLDPNHLARLRAVVPSAPLWAGSGVTPELAGRLDIDGAIVGTWLHQDADLTQPLETQRVHAMKAALSR